MIIKKNLPIKIIVFTVILDSIGIGIMIPVLPNLMTGVLPGRTVAEAAVWGGILASIFAIMQFIFGPILGSLSDAFGRRPVILISLIFMALDYVIMGLATSVWVLLFGRILGGITASTHSTAAAYCRHFQFRTKGRPFWLYWSRIWHWIRSWAYSRWCTRRNWTTDSIFCSGFCFGFKCNSLLFFPPRKFK